MVSGSHTGQAQRLMAMGQMAASLAHEIRNPLGSMELFCSLLKKDLQNQPQALNLAEEIHRGIHRLERVISNCLQFARDLKPRRVPNTSVVELCRQVRQDALAKAQDFGGRIEIECASYLPPVNIDPYLFHQALLNVVLNALEATERAAEIRGLRAADIPPVKIINTGDETRWVCEVRDSGLGVSESEREKIFDPFFTTKEKGTGLGLAIVHSIITAHGGEIEFDSTQGQGSLVRITIMNHNEIQGE